MSFPLEDLVHQDHAPFVPSAPAPVTPNVDIVVKVMIMMMVVAIMMMIMMMMIMIVVKGLPGAGPRLTGAKTTYSPPLYSQLPYEHFLKWSPEKPICDDKVCYMLT